MATVVSLEPATMEALDHAVSSGRFSSRDEAIRSALQLVWDSDAEAAAEPLTLEELAAIDEGLADLRAGRTYPLEQVRAELAKRYARHG